MALVDYSDSETSDVGEKPISKAAPHPSKGTFQKVVDRSNPGKIRVSLPQAAPKDDTDGNEPPAKRIKKCGGLGDFNSLLPPPKRTSVVLTGGLDSGIRKSGLAAGVSLITGTEPKFSREPEPNSDVELNTEGYETWDRGDSTGVLNLPKPKSIETSQTFTKEVTPVGKPLMFKPLSVARKPAKKSKQTEAPSSTTSQISIIHNAEKALLQPKMSFFSISAEPSDSTKSKPNGDYQPLVFGVSVGENDTQPQDEPEFIGDSAKQAQYTTPAPATATLVTQSLSGIASDLNLSEAEKRRLFGRQKGSKNSAMPSATKIINFNTDEEYKHNEELRAAGEQVVHNPVRSIAPGKHSLRQLVNAAASQKEALEESFAKGKNNRAEASSRYGW